MPHGLPRAVPAGDVDDQLEGPSALPPATLSVAASRLPATRSEEVAVIEAVVWVACGVTIVACALRCRRRPAALRTGRWATGFLFVCAGAGINAFYVLRGDDYARFADTS